MAIEKLKFKYPIVNEYNQPYVTTNEVENAFYDLEALIGSYYSDKVIIHDGKWYNDYVGIYNGISKESVIAVLIPNTVDTVDMAALSGHKNLKYVKIPSSVKTLGTVSFSGCENLEYIELPDSITKIGAEAFKGCTNLKRITLPFAGAELNGTYNTNFGYIFGANSFSNNGEYVPASLKSVTITGKNATSIAPQTFWNCSNLTNIVIGGDITSIGTQAFHGCSSLNSIEISKKVTNLSTGVFQGCSNLESLTIPFIGVTREDTEHCRIGWLFSFEPTLNNQGDLVQNLQRVVITDATQIGINAFVGCSGLTSVHINRGVTTIGQSAFRGCVNLSNITFGGTTIEWLLITKETGWNFSVPAKQVVCSDGVSSI